MLQIGAHVHHEEPRAAAKERGADLVQIFLGDPQGWKGPVTPPELDGIRDAGLDVYVHAPYVINVATTNNRIRIPSRKLLTQHATAAAAIGAKGLIVHGGHVLAGDDPATGFDNWRKTFDRARDDGGFPLPILIENTAGGDRAMARRLDAIARLWEALDDHAGTGTLGFCLDTCHFHAGGEDLVDVVDRVTAITGRVDLVHANDSKDAFDSGRDRHENLGSGMIAADALVAVVRAAAAPVVCETPGGADGQGADISYLRERLAGS